MSPPAADNGDGRSFVRLRSTDRSRLPVRVVVVAVLVTVVLAGTGTAVSVPTPAAAPSPAGPDAAASGSVAAVDDRPVAATQSNGTATLRLARYPADRRLPATIDDFATAQSEGTVTRLSRQTPTAVPGEALVVTIRADGLDEALSSYPGDPRRQFNSLVADSGRDFVVLRTDEPAGQRPRGIDPLSTNGEVIDGTEPDTYHVVVPLVAASVRNDRGLATGRYRVVTSFDTVLEGDLPEPTLAIAEPSVTFVAPEGRSRPLLAFGETEPVYGRTNIAPGSTVTVVFEHAARTDSDEARIERINGRTGFRAQFDVTERMFSPGFTSRLWVRRGGERIGVQTVDARRLSASLSVPAQTGDGRVTVENVSLSHGGFVAVETTGGARLGVVSVTATAPDQATGTLRVPVRVNRETRVRAVPYRDLDGDGELDDQDEPYRVDGTVVAATGRYRPASTPTPTATPTATPTPTPTATPTPTPTDTPTPTVTTDDGFEPPSGMPTPGFGPVAVVVALGVLAALAARRR